MMAMAKLLGLYRHLSKSCLLWTLGVNLISSSVTVLYTKRLMPVGCCVEDFLQGDQHMQITTVAIDDIQIGQRRWRFPKNWRD